MQSWSFRVKLSKPTEIPKQGELNKARRLDATIIADYTAVRQPSSRASRRKYYLRYLEHHTLPLHVSDQPSTVLRGYQWTITKDAVVTQVPFQSRISGKTEYRPVCGSVMGHKGGDSNLVNVVRKAFETAQWRTKADTGSLTFPL